MSGQWTHEQVLLLIACYRSSKDKLKEKKLVKKKELWIEIGKVFKENGYKKSRKDCDDKWRALVRTYRHIKDRTKKSGRCSSEKNWRYFAAMDDIEDSTVSAGGVHEVEATPCSSGRRHLEADDDTQDTSGVSGVTLEDAIGTAISHSII
jgi:hypothetical protein